MTAISDPRVEAHALNHAFSWTNHDGPFRVVSPDQARAYDEQGFFVLEDAIPPADLAALVAEIDPFEEKMEQLLQGLDGGKLFIARSGEITFTTHLVTRSARLRDFVGGPLLRGLVADLIGPDVRLYWDQAVYKKPGTEAPFPWHQDNGYAFVEPQQYLTCWIALTDATEDNGCPWVLPGLHRSGTLRHADSDLGFVCLTDAPDAVPVPARAGSIVVFSSLTPHSTGPNRTDAVRKAYIVQYAPDGAAVLTGDGDGDTPPARQPADDPDRQFPVLVDGQAPTAG
jgi:ectoine hydroxylase-related dioxygenase (phytanoyl-CoA dioxygenase family)